jgi:hypothetical protein
MPSSIHPLSKSPAQPNPLTLDPHNHHPCPLCATFNYCYIFDTLHLPVLPTICISLGFALAYCSMTHAAILRMVLEAGSDSELEVNGRELRRVCGADEQYRSVSMRVMMLSLRLTLTNPDYRTASSWYPGSHV